MLKQGTHIFYADDDEDDHIFFKEALAAIPDSNCNITSAYNGAEVLDILLNRGRYRDQEIVHPDFLIIDLNMPVIDGFGILKELRAHSKTRTLPVYILSVSDKEHDKLLCKRLGCTGFYTKPVNFVQLTKVIRQILDSGNHASGHEEIKE